MRNNLLVPALAAALSFPVTSVLAQVTYDSNVGAALGASNDSISAGNVLGFNFTMPDGSVVSAIDIDSNGRILAPGGDTSDATESRLEFRQQSASICAFWDNITPSGTGDLYFNAYHDGTRNIAVITWQNFVENSGGPVFTTQVVLRDNDTFTMWWDVTAPMGDCMVGVSPGGGVPEPGEWNFDCGPTIASNGNPIVYQKFGNGTFDLAGTWLEWTPDGIGGWLVITSTLVGICTPPVPPATSSTTGQGCGGIPTPPREIDWIPDGSGGYIVLPSGNSWDPNYGAASGIQFDDDTVGASLGFNFTMPDGSVVNAIEIDSNGRLMTSSTPGSDFSPTMAEFLTDGGLIAPLWGDFNVADADTTGDIMFATNNVDYAVVTWDRVVQYNGSTPLTWQVQLFGENHPSNPNGWTVLYNDLDAFDMAISLAATNWVIGCSDGVSADPGESDMSSLPLVNIGVPIVYEFFDNSIPDAFDVYADGPAGLYLSSPSSNPVIGSTFNLVLDNIAPSSSAAWMLIGFRNVNTDLSILGVPCTLYSSVNFPAQPMTYTLGAETATYSLPISGAPGIPLVMQAAVVNLGSNPLGIEFSNAVTGRTGG